MAEALDQGSSQSLPQTPLLRSPGQWAEGSRGSPLLCHLTCRDEEELRRSLSELADPNPKVIKRVSGGSGSSSSPFLDLTPEPGAAVYKHGALVRKVHADPDCRKSTWPLWGAGWGSG